MLLIVSVVGIHQVQRNRGCRCRTSGLTRWSVLLVGVVLDIGIGIDSCVVETSCLRRKSRMAVAAAAAAAAAFFLLLGSVFIEMKLDKDSLRFSIIYKHHHQAYACANKSHQQGHQRHRIGWTKLRNAPGTHQTSNLDSFRVLVLILPSRRLNLLWLIR